MSKISDPVMLVSQPDTKAGLYLRAKLNHLKKIRVGAVSYLNTKPLLYGVKRHPILDSIELIEDYPARIAQMLVDDEIDVGLIPVAATRRLAEWHIVSDYGIGAVGPVASVCLFSEVPMEQVETVILDYQSRTSVNLARVLLKEYWKKDVKLVNAEGEDFRNQISGSTAGVIIGDRALEQRSKSKYIYDLAQAWIDHTGLPFVFAAWISNKELPEDFKQSFNVANAIGLSKIDKVVAENSFPFFDLKTYYTDCISYEIDEAKKQGLMLFLEKLSALQSVPL